jgi:hypothetical protein
VLSFGDEITISGNNILLPIAFNVASLAAHLQI